MKEPRRLFGKKRPPVPPPPELDALRGASGAIDPERTYEMALPDGTIFVARGSELLGTAQAMIDLADADAAGDEWGVIEAIARVTAEGPTRGRAVILCVKVGRCPVAPPPGYLTIDCGTCGCAAWISPTNHERVAAVKARVMCSECAGSPGHPGNG